MNVMEKEDSLLAKMKESGSCISFEDWETEAKRVMEIGPFGYIQSGAGNEETLRKNSAAFTKYSVVPKVLKAVTAPDYSLSLFGQKLSLPIMLAPVGMQAIAHPDGDLASSKAAGSMELPFIASTVASYSLEEIAAVNSAGQNWFQLYWSEDRELSLSFVKRAEAAGYTALIVTVDTVSLGWREKDLKNKYSPLRAGFGKANYLTDSYFQTLVDITDKAASIEEVAKHVHHPSLSWKDLIWLKKQINLPIILKGILEPEEAKQAEELGFSGVIVSNHGGRQLDGVISALDALPLVRAAVSAEFPIIFDSGIRRGSDILKAIALGADAVCIGRPFVYGLAVEGENGVRKVIGNIIEDFKVSAALAGAKNHKELKTIRLVKD